MSQVDVKKQSGAKAGRVELDEAIFGIQPNMPVLHQVVTAQLAARRAGSQSTKTRAEVAGGGAKPWRQKGTGRSRQGSIRSPQWRGGGIALGPKPRSFKQRTPKKMVQLALRSALSDRAADGKVIVIDRWDFERPRTKDALAALAALELDGRVLLVFGPDDQQAWLSFRNLQHVHCMSAGELNAYDVLCSDWVVFTRQTLPGAKPDTETPIEIAATDDGPTAAEAPAGAADDARSIAEGGAGEAEGRVAPEDIDSGGTAVREQTADSLDEEGR
ncbi:MAG: 50S ribosomal protein L4 [Acidimicrobiales bacterium]